MSKYSRSGGKYTRAHSTLIPFATEICDALNIQPEVTKISLGFITSGLRSSNNNRRLKIKGDIGSLLLSVRDNKATQEIRIYTSDLEKTKRDIVKYAEGIDVEVSIT
ncbi:DUF2103 domain-containing protein [Patescibacteria group bacterium]|nr:DUF2103 domain-containing protein [Patescibacteria group bacterium]